MEEITQSYEILQQLWTQLPWIIQLVASAIAYMIIWMFKNSIGKKFSNELEVTKLKLAESEKEVEEIKTSIRDLSMSVHDQRANIDKISNTVSKVVTKNEEREN